MPRRASSGINTGQIIGITAAIIGFILAAVLLVYVVAGGFFGGGKSGSGSGDVDFKNATELRLSVYQENTSAMRGNVYKVTGVIDETLKWTPDRGRLVVMEATDGMTSMLLPILVPEQFSNNHLERGTSISMLVRGDRDGVLVAEAIEN